MDSAEASEATTFRRAGPDDVDAIVALVDSAYRGDTSRQGWTTEADLLDGQRVDHAMLDAALAAGAYILVADDDQGLVACAQLDRGVETASFGLFAVRPSHQGRGVGRLVLAEAERIARDRWGSTHLEMTVLRQRGELLAFYARRGYHGTGESRPFPYGDERYGRPRRSDLAFTLLSKVLV